MNISTRKRIKTLNEETKVLAKKFLPLADEWLKENGWEDYTFEITEARRDLETQAGLFSIGRTYIHWGGWKITDMKKIVTWTMKSNHITGDAFDGALYKEKIYHWPDPDIFKNKVMWLALAEISKNIGMYPGGLWENQKPDYPHFSRLPG